MTHRLIEWANLNTGSTNLPGLGRFRALLKKEFESLGGQASEIELPPLETISDRGEIVLQPIANALSVQKRPDASLRIFLCIHMDTVYPPDHPFQTCTRLNPQTLQGPGVADAKGGLIVMLTALAALEQSPLAEKIGWEVLINPDEEIGSISSAPLLTAAATRNRVGLLFEPALADGTMVDRRKGSGGFGIIVRGKSAHAGRDFDQGRNALVAAAWLTVALHDLNRQLDGVTLNIAKVDGGGPTNVVPDLAILRFNVRITNPDDAPKVLDRIHRLVAETATRDGITAQLHGGFHSPPKIPDPRAHLLMDLVNRCGQTLNLPIQWKSSGGTCDGNKLAAAGLPNIDTMGPCGGNLHSPNEFILAESLAQRAKLAALVMLGLIDGSYEL
jgi:glutamate carboxypeptidase